MTYNRGKKGCGIVTYDGYWENGKKHHKGKENFIKDGIEYTYSGFFQNNQRHGEGELSWS